MDFKTYEVYMKKRKTKYEVGLHHLCFDKVQPYTLDITIGVYDKKEAKKIKKAVDIVLDYVGVKSKILGINLNK